ncbi:transmembrane anchor protein [Psychrobacter sp. P2G3]|uniref:transmembrane anchor protein n=1 Tax=Psychrobacter sp. P2G3 TaxID=1699622 RepID=UPI00078D7865|nr:transmembrane anchor protein [Psychrobacter sp. P2G3]AMN50277.1 transmembrane anchor protein [Psychrobacter sp. P2G3]
MYNSDTPLQAELPSSKQLMKSTILAAIAAIVLLFTVVLPAEYGIDPIGVGNLLRLTEMGQVKQQLAEEAAADAAGLLATDTLTSETVDIDNVTEQAMSATLADTAVASGQWRDEIPFTLTSGEGLEIKMKMDSGDKTEYSWVVTGGKVNFDTHGDASGKAIIYEKGRGVAADEGVLEAAFTGNHGWFWRNRGESDVQVVLRTRGDYSTIKTM